MKFHVLTLFPEMIEQGLSPSIIGKAAEKNIIAINPVNIRDYTQERHGKVDDTPYGGGAGMLMQAQPVYDAHRAVSGSRKLRTVYLTPQGRPFDQKLARELAKEEELILLCGHYEGIDERVLEEVVTDYVSIGDYVLTGGELAAMVIIDAVARLIPGVLGNETSAQEESFHNDLLEYPQYSRPEVWQGKSVPKVLLSGNHREVEKWRLEQAKERTKQMRPDLYERYEARQQLIKQLSRDKRNNIHIMECLARGNGEILYAQGEDIAVYHRDGSTCMVKASSPESGRRLLKRCPEDAGWYVVSQEYIRDLLKERGYKEFCECHQFLYTQREPLPVEHKDIRRLGLESLDYICRHYDTMSVSKLEQANPVQDEQRMPITGYACDMGDSEYVRDRLLNGVMYGAFVEERLVAFIGIHDEGSLGMLYVEEPYRGRGIAASLEAYSVNRMLERGWIPYGNVIAGNEASVRLQEKLGFYQAKDTFWWMEK